MFSPPAPEITSEEPQQGLVPMRLRIVGLERDCLVVARQRLVEPLQLLQRNAAVGEGIRIAGLERDRLVVARQRLVEALGSFSALPRL